MPIHFRVRIRLLVDETVTVGIDHTPVHIANVIIQMAPRANLSALAARET